MDKKFSDNSLVSVLIPSFNHEKYVIRCLQSLLEDGYPNIEVVFIDDGSSDHTFNLAQDWLKEYSRSFYSVHCMKQENIGVVRTLNKLLMLAKGEFITLLASDDYLLPGGIQARVAYLKKNPYLLAVIGDCVVIDDAGNKRMESGIADLRHGNKRLLSNPKYICRELLLRWSIPGPVLLLRKIAFDSELGVGRYDESLLIEDRDFYLKLLAKKALGFIDVRVSAYRIHGTNFSSEYAPHRAEQLKDMGEAAKRNYRLFSGVDQTILKMQAASFEMSASQLKSNRVMDKLLAVILWKALGFTYRVHILFCK